MDGTRGFPRCLARPLGVGSARTAGACLEREVAPMGEDLIAFVVDLGVSDCADGFPDWGPYLWKQLQHVGLGRLAGALSLNFAAPVFGLWAVKELFLDNYANGGSLLVALDSFADLVIGGVACLLVLARTRSAR